MRHLLFLCCLMAQPLIAQPGFNKGYDFGYFINRFNDVVVQNDTIVCYGLAQDTIWPYQQGLLVARFDTFGESIDHVIILDTTNNIYSIDDSWGKIIATTDGGYAMTTATVYGRDGVFIKLDHNLDLEFVQRYRDTINEGEFLISPIEIPEGFLLYGFYNRAGNAKFDALLRKVDKKGDMIWRKNYGTNLWFESFDKAEPMGDSLWVISGRKVFDISAPGTSLPWVVVFNDRGELKWEWTNSSITEFNGINTGWFFPRPDSTWMVIGSKYLGEDPVYHFSRQQAYWLKLDKDFKYVWSRPFGPNLNPLNLFLKVIEAPNKDMIGIGLRGPFDWDLEGFYQKGWVMRFSSEADSLWDWTGKRPIPNPGAHILSGGALLSSGSIIGTGYGEDSIGHTFCWVVKLSPDGCVDTLFCHTTPTWEPQTKEEITFQVYPNPAREQVEVRIVGDALPKDARIVLRDVTGRILKEYAISSAVQSLSLVGVPGGVYWVQLLSAEGWTLGWKKVVVVP